MGLVGIVNLGNLLTVSPPMTIANLLICGPGVGRARLKNRKGLLRLDNAPKSCPFCPFPNDYRMTSKLEYAHMEVSDD
jgi:hypothetical protein